MGSSIRRLQSGAEIMQLHVRKPFLFLALVLAASGCTPPLLSDQQDWGEGVENFKSAELLSNANGRYAHWQAIGRVRVDGGRICSGSLIDTRGANPESDGSAYVLTSGHCAKGDSNRYLVDTPASGSVQFDFFHDTQSRQTSYTVKSIAWSTLRGRDIALLELDRTLGQLMDNGIMPLKLATQPLAVDSNVLVVGAPVDNHLHRVACPQEQAADVFEAGWTWIDQLKNRCLDVTPGVSGSPVLDRYTNEIVAIIGTTTRDSGRSRCTLNTPCEVSNGNAVTLPATNYATAITQLPACFNDGHFSPRSNACMLGPVTNFEAAFGDVFLRILRDQNGEFIPLQWQQTFTTDQPFYRVKLARTPGDCALVDNYGPVQTSLGNGADHASHDLREGPGLYFMCIIGQQHKAGPASRWAAFNARIYYRWLLAEPVQTSPVYSVFEDSKDVFTVRPVGISPDLDLSRYQYKIGQPNTLDCYDTEGYQVVRPPLLDFQVPVADGRKKVCLKTADMAGNPSPIVDFQLPEQSH